MQLRSTYTCIGTVLLIFELVGCSVISQPVQEDGPTLVAPRIALTFKDTKHEFTRSLEDANWCLTTSQEIAEQVHPALITNAKRWGEVWSQLEPISPLPEVDFKRNFLFIRRMDANDRNRLQLDFSINDDGVLSATGIQTLLGFRPSESRKVYVFEIPRNGIKAYRDETSPSSQSQVYTIATP